MPINNEQLEEKKSYKPQNFFNKPISSKTGIRILSWFIFLTISATIALYLLSLGQIQLNIQSYIKGDLASAKKIISTQLEKVVNKFTISKTDKPVIKNSEAEDILAVPKKIINLEQVSNVGYQFFLGEIEFDGTTNLTENLKNEITQIIYKGKVPKSLLKNLGIIIVNTLAAEPDLYINTPTGEVRVSDFNPSFLEGGGVYSQNVKGFSLIYINKTKISLGIEEAQIAAILGDSKGSLDSSSLRNILAHELGHHIGDTLTASDWSEYYKLRKIPDNIPKRSSDWRQSPVEDFAEVYANIYFDKGINTVFGFLDGRDFGGACDSILQKLIDDYNKSKNLTPLQKMNTYFDTNLIKKLSEDDSVQACRKDVLLHPEKYKDDYGFFWMPYYSIVDNPTKDFMANIIRQL